MKKFGVLIFAVAMFVPTTFSQYSPILSKESAGRVLSFVGDKSIKEFYALKCAEVAAILVGNEIPFFNREEAETAGFKLSDTCTDRKPDNAKNENPKIKKTAKPIKAKNLLALGNELSKFIDQPVILDGTINLGRRYPNKFKDYGEKYFTLFSFRDKSNTDLDLVLMVPTGEDSDELKKLIIDEGGWGINGTFTFIVIKEEGNWDWWGELISYTLYIPRRTQ